MMLKKMPFTCRKFTLLILSILVLSVFQQCGSKANLGTFDIVQDASTTKLIQLTNASWQAELGTIDTVGIPGGKTGPAVPATYVHVKGTISNVSSEPVALSKKPCGVNRLAPTFSLQVVVESANLKRTFSGECNISIDSSNPNQTRSPILKPGESAEFSLKILVEDKGDPIRMFKHVTVDRVSGFVFENTH